MLGKRRVAAILAGLLAALLLGACGGASTPEVVTVRETVIVEGESQVVEVEVTAPPLVPAKLTTGWVHAGGSSAPIFMAEEKGWFSEGGVNIDIVRGYGGTDVVSKVAAGTYEAGTGYLAELIRGISENPGLDAIVAVISYDGDPNALTGIEGLAPVTAEEIPGTRISAVTGSTAQLLFPIYAEAVGFDPETVEFVNVTSQLVPVMVEQGDADLATGFISTSISNFGRLGFEADELVIHRYSDYLQIYGNGLILRRSWAESNPEAARGLVRAYIRGLIYTRENPDEAIDVLLNREPLLDREIELTDWELAAENYYFTDRVLERGIGYHTAEQVQAYIDIIVEGFGLERTPSLDEFYDPQYLPPLEDRTVAQ